MLEDPGVREATVFEPPSEDGQIVNVGCMVPGGGYPSDGFYGHPRFQVKTTHVKVGFFEGLYFGLGLLVSGVLFTIMMSVIFLCASGALILLVLGVLSP